MKALVDSFFFNDENSNGKMQLFFAVCFPFFTVFALGIDSVTFAQNCFDAQSLTNVLAIIYFSFFIWFSGSYLRKLMVVMVLLSYIGELLFCSLLGMYHYRLESIPLYVPFGHAIVYASGYVFAHTEWALDNDKLLKKYFAIAFSILFLCVAVLLQDVFSLVFGVFFFLLLKRKKWQNLYYFIALCVVFIELVGTYFQCWKWESEIFNVIPAANPPMGAVFFYAGGDVLLAKIVDFWKVKAKSKLIEVCD